MLWSKCIQIGGSTVGEGFPAFLVAEIGSNHNQDLIKAIELIDAAAESGADAVKFQSLRLDQVHHAKHVGEDFKRFFQQIELSESWYQDLLEHSRKRNVEFISSPTYYRAIELLARLPAAALKIASAQFGIHPWMVGEAAATNLPLIASTGLVTFEEVANQMRIIEESGNDQLVLLHCVSQYPTPVERVNLAMMNRYRDAFRCLVGFSDHTRSTRLPGVAVGQGACVIEKHITLNRDLPGPDHHFAMEPDEFREMVEGVRETEMAMGSPEKAPFSDEEEYFRRTFVYKCVLAESVKAGEPLGNVEREARRAEDDGIDVRLAEVLHRDFVAARDVSAGELITWNDLRCVR